MEPANTGLIGMLFASANSFGGGLALLFIVSLSAAILLLAVLYVGSAIVVLERFARVARRPLGLGLAVVLVALVASFLMLPEVAPGALAGERQGKLASLGPALARAVGLTVLCTALLRAVLRWIPTERVGHGVVVFVAACVALIAGASGGVVGAIPPVVLLGAAGLVLRMRRRRRGEPRASLIEFRLCVMAAVSCVGVLAGLLPQAAAAQAWRAAEGGLAGLVVVLLLGLVPLAIAGLFEMRRSAEWFIAVRYLVAKRRQVFISAITAICVVGIAAGVWLLIVVLSVMNGFEQTWREEILGNRAHFLVQNGTGSFPDYEAVVERIRAVPGVVAASPYIDADAMVRGRAGEIYSVRVRGVDPDRIGDVTRLEDDVLSGSLSALGEAAPGEDEGEGAGDPARPPPPPMLIGHQLAASLGIGVGDDLLLISPFGGPPTPLGPAPRLSRFRIAGVFRSSFYQYDEIYTYTNIAAAQAFRRAGPVIDGVEALTDDYYRSQVVGDRVADALGFPFYTKDWKEYFPAFFQALKTERVMMFLLLTMIMVVAAFVIVATLIMMIMEKSSDIAILKAMGAEDALIERVFALEGTLIGLVGTALGVVAGLAVTHRLTWIQAQIESLTGVDTLPTTVYQLSTLPSRIDPQQIAGVVAIAMILSLGATLLPSRQGARLDPAEGLRHE